MAETEGILQTTVPSEWLHRLQLLVTTWLLSPSRLESQARQRFPHPPTSGFWPGDKKCLKEQICSQKQLRAHVPTVDKPAVLLAVLRAGRVTAPCGAAPRTPHVASAAIPRAPGGSSGCPAPLPLCSQSAGPRIQPGLPNPLAFPWSLCGLWGFHLVAIWSN